MADQRVQVNLRSGARFFNTLPNRCEFLSKAGSELDLEPERGSHAMDFRIKAFSKMRLVSNPEDGLRTLIERAPRAKAWAEGVIRRLRPTCITLYGIRRHLATGVVAVVSVWFFVHVMFGLNGMVVYRQKKAEFHSLQQQIRDLKQENVRYSEQIHSLQTDPKAIEKEAREQLHYARPGEVIYVSPSPVSPPGPERKTAKK